MPKRPKDMGKMSEQMHGLASLPKLMTNCTACPPGLASKLVARKKKAKKAK